MGEAELRAGRLLLESELESVRAAAAVVQGEVEGLRAEYGAAVKERNEAKERLRELVQQLEVAEKEMVVWKQRAHKMQAHEAKIDKLDRLIAQAAGYADRIRDNDAEMARMEDDIRAILAQTAVRDEKDRELQQLKTRTRQLEKDSREAAKWRAQVKALEKDAHEASRWKTLVKQGKVREKTLELQLKELHHWRQRARAFEKEVKALRGWKRAVCELAVREGHEAMIPEFPLEGGLDSSGGSDMLSSGGSGLGDSGSGSGISGLLSGGSVADGSNAHGAPASGRFFDLIRNNGPSAGSGAGAQGGVGYIDYDYDASMPSQPTFDSEAEFMSHLQQRSLAEFDASAPDDEDMDLQSLMSAYAANNDHQQHRHSAYLSADQSDDASLLAASTDDGSYDLNPSQYDASFDDDDDHELMTAGTSDKRIKESLARAAYSAAPSSASDAPLSAGGLGSYALPSRIRSVPTFYPSSTASAFNSSIVYDEAPVAQGTLPALPALHPPAFPVASSGHHPFFSSWPAPSSASPLLIIDDRNQPRAASNASTASTASIGSMGPPGHPFSISSPSPFDSTPITADEAHDDGSPSSVHRLKQQQLATALLGHAMQHGGGGTGASGGGVWGVGALENSAAPPGLSASAVGRFSSPLVIIDDGVASAAK